MDVHRCRFVPYPASAINAVAFSHPHISTANKHNKSVPARLAIGRANGDIEIWNPLQGGWLHELTIAGGKDRSVEGLAWIVGDDEELDGGKAVSHGRMRLFSIGYTNTITEWDLENACAKRHASGQHGEIWCLATQPKPAAATATATATASTATQRLVGGTMDGCLVLYNTEDDDLRFQRLCRTHKKNVKMTCIAFQSRQIAVVGCSDSTIRVFDVRNGAILHAMTLGRDLVGGAKDVIVWSVRCLPNGDIVSGDSTGQICIWDGRTYTQAQRIQGHTQDVLSLTTSADGSAIVSGGMDRRVVLYREMASRSSRWAKVWHRRYHQHDVKAMASFETKNISVVVAGGPDATPVVLPLQRSGKEHHRALSHLPQTVPLASAPNARLLLSWWDRQVDIWTLDASIDQMLSEADAADADIDRHRRLIGRVQLQSEANITSAAITADGTLLVVATSTEVKAFQLQRGTAAPGKVLTISISKVLVPPAVGSKGAASVTVSPDGRWVCLTRGVDNYVTVLQVSSSSSSSSASAARISFRPKPLRLSRLKRSIPRYELVSGLGRYDRRITQTSFSPDSRMLATSDLAGYIDTWVLRSPGDADEQADGEEEEEEQEAGGRGANVDAQSNASSSSDSDSDSDDDNDNDEHQDADHGDGSRWIRNPHARQLPKLSAAPVVLSFAPDVPGAPSVTGASEAGTTARDYVLLAITSSSRLYVFNPLRARLAPWFRRLHATNLPLEYRNIRDLAKGVLWQGPRAWIYGASFVFMIDTSVEPGSGSTTAEGSSNNPASALVRATTTEQTPMKRKRKRGDDTGAGGKMEQGRLGPHRVLKAVAREEDQGTKGGSNNEWVDVDMDDVDGDTRRTNDDSDSDDDDDASSDSDGADGQQVLPQRHSGKDEVSTQQSNQKQLQQLQQNQQHQQAKKRWWHTFKYRPILGVVPLAAYDDDAAATAAAASSSDAYPILEVALVERPGWDMDLPARYDGDE